jgi:hypothetical protein
MIKVILGRHGDLFFWLQISRIDGVSGSFVMEGSPLMICTKPLVKSKVGLPAFLEPSITAGDIVRREKRIR